MSYDAPKECPDGSASTAWDYSVLSNINPFVSAWDNESITEEKHAWSICVVSSIINRIRVSRIRAPSSQCIGLLMGRPVFENWLERIIVCISHL